MVLKLSQTSVIIEKLGMHGEGIARHEGQVVFVPFALPGETASLLIEKTEKRYARGKLLGISNPSPQRVHAPCPHFGVCGGCTVQHLSYQGQLQMKHNNVISAYRSAGLTTDIVQPAIGMMEPWHYRNKTAMIAKEVLGAQRTGMYAQRKQEFVPVPTCLIASKLSNQAIQTVERWMQQQGIPTADAGQKDNYLRHIVARSNTKGQVMVTLVGKLDNELNKTSSLVEMLKADLPGFASLCLSIPDKNSKAILGQTYSVVYGASHLLETLGGFDFATSPLSFFQVNTYVAEKMYEHVIKEAALTPSETLVDVYCGTGTMTLLAARHCKQAIGIELSTVSVADAISNAARNDVGNASFHAGAAEDLLPIFAKGQLQPDVVLVDPPKMGVSPAALSAITAIAPKRIVYVACNPATQGRDVRLLLEKGYTITRVQPFDMFCQTAEVESVVTLQKRA